MWYDLVKEVVIMTSIPVSTARQNIYQLIDKVAQTHEPVAISGKRNSAVLIGADDWRSINETLYLLSIPKMRETIVKGLATPPEKCKKELKW